MSTFVERLRRDSVPIGVATGVVFMTAFAIEGETLGKGPCLVELVVCHMEAVPPPEHSPERPPTAPMLGFTNTAIVSVMTSAGSIAPTLR